MKNYCLKNKLVVTEEFLNDLTTKSWQEVEQLQTQITSIENTQETAAIIQLLNNLLTSYYVFIGGLENLSDKNPIMINSVPEPTKAAEQIVPELDASPEKVIEKEVSYVSNIKQETAEFEPFEYFTDFDEPFGDPISDEDLYGKN